MNDMLAYNQVLDDELSRRGIEHTSETPPIQDLPIHVDMSGASIDFKKYAEFGTNHLIHWVQMLEERHPRHICMVSSSFIETITWYKQSQPPLPARYAVFDPEDVETFDPDSYELYDPKKHQVFVGMIGQKKYFVPTMEPGFKPRRNFKVAKGDQYVILHADPGHRAKQIVIKNVDLFRRQLTRCHRKSTRPRFQAFPLYLDFGTTKGHANMIVVDTEQGIVTRFEPYGARKMKAYDPRDVDSEVRRVLVPVIESALGISVVRTVAPSDFCPLLGLQCTERRQTRYPAQTKKVLGKVVNVEKGGYCDAWSAMWLHYRILNPNKSDKQVYDMIHAGWDDLATKIRAYVTAIVTSFMEKLAKEKEESLRGT